MRPTAGNAALRPAQNSSRFVLVLRHPAGRGVALAGDRIDLLDQVIDLRLPAVQLDDQQRLDVERIAGMHELLDRMDRRAVHHLHAAGDDAGADDAPDAGTGIFRCRKSDQQRARGLRLLEDTDGDFGDDAEQPLRPGDDAEQIITVGIEMLAADAQDLAGDQDDLDAEHVVRGHAVFQAMHAAGILRDIAADGAGDLRRRVGRVIKAAMSSPHSICRDW